MASSITGPELERLIQILSKLPGLGPRSARRATLHLMKKRDVLLKPLIDAMEQAYERLTLCPVCGNIDTVSPCTLCQDPRRDRSTLIVVEDIPDLWALEKAQVLNASYHVLGGVLSPLDGIGPDDLSIARLVERARTDEVKELILAVNATVEGQTTAHYITDCLEGCQVKITRLAHGVPIGGELDYLDEGTLSAAMRARTELK
jgi:recombination protein RecR